MGLVSTTLFFLLNFCNLLLGFPSPMGEKRLHPGGNGSHWMKNVSSGMKPHPHFVHSIMMNCNIHTYVINITHYMYTEKNVSRHSLGRSRGIPSDLPQYDDFLRSGKITCTRCNSPAFLPTETRTKLLA